MDFYVIWLSRSIIAKNLLAKMKITQIIHSLKEPSLKPSLLIQLSLNIDEHMKITMKSVNILEKEIISRQLLK
jgi:hypothetical protein